MSTVQKGAFQEFIPVIGMVLPITTLYLDASESGRVDPLDIGTIYQNHQTLKTFALDLYVTLYNDTGLIITHKTFLYPL